MTRRTSPASSSASRARCRVRSGSPRPGCRVFAIRFAARVPEQVDRPAQERDASVDVVVLLPEAARLPGDLVGLGVLDVLQRRARLLLQAARDVLEQRQRQRADAVVAGDRPGGPGRRVAVEHADAVRRALDLLHRRAIPDRRAQAGRKGRGDAIHAADRLHHRRLHVERLVEEHPVPEIRVHQRRHAERIVGFRRLDSGTRPLRARRSGSSRDTGTRASRSPYLREERQQPVAVLLHQLLVERMPVDRFGQQLGDMSARVVDDPALFDRLAVEGARRLQPRAARHVDLDLERHAKLAAVAEDVRVDRRQARRARVEVLAVAELAALRRAVRELDLRAASHGPVAAAGSIARLEHRAPGSRPCFSSQAATRPAMPPPRTTTCVPAPEPGGNCTGVDARFGLEQTHARAWSRTRRQSRLPALLV